MSSNTEQTHVRSTYRELRFRGTCLLPGPKANHGCRCELVELDVNALAVVDIRGSIEGVLTDHDIIRALVKNGPAFYEQTVGSCMSSPVVSCEIDTSLPDALKLMSQHGIRHLALLRDGAFVRMITLKDLLERIHQDDLLEAATLRDIAVSRLVPPG